MTEHGFAAGCYYPGNAGVIPGIFCDLQPSVSAKPEPPSPDEPFQQFDNGHGSGACCNSPFLFSRQKFQNG